jgi:hypothetical protein
VTLQADIEPFSGVSEVGNGEPTLSKTRTAIRQAVIQALEKHGNDSEVRRQ